MNYTFWLILIFLLKRNDRNIEKCIAEVWRLFLPHALYDMLSFEIIIIFVDIFRSE